ncbi:hypothetical protein LX64_05174 [Chitinophaga skermanii]|uniref:Uncharacterized protein n=1 Tax=Chitinophaga skermanii TaxID=331697 RepID=A0A327PZE8_9BACT|nr:hypothetical protein [Chitinophaga skermanii]RAI96994.1 hypothetical protein LX64_05174 [Chitinophaga skermanii]
MTANDPTTKREPIEKETTQFNFPLDNAVFTEMKLISIKGQIKQKQLGLMLVDNFLKLSEHEQLELIRAYKEENGIK